MGVIVIVLVFVIGFIIIAVVRYAVDSSKTSVRLAELVTEVQYLRSEISKQNDLIIRENKPIIDKRI